MGRQRARSWAMAKTSTAPTQLKRGTKVVARAGLRDVPEGTEGKVILVDGLTWIRYWVRFANGEYLGSINRHELATRDEWARHLRGEDEIEVATGADGSDDAAAADDGDGGGGGKTTPSGTLIPQKLLDRSASARARLAA